MLTAFLESGRVIHAKEYDPAKHGYSLFCIDTGCRAPVIFIEEIESKRKAHFKTVGKGSESKHTPQCGFYEAELDVVTAIEKTTEYQKVILQAEGVPKHVINVNLRRLDPDYEAKVVDKKEEEKEKEEDKVKIKDDRESPGSVGSMKSVMKLLTSYEPDVLASIYFSVGGGLKLPMSQVVLNTERAYATLWEDRVPRGMKYFVYGTVRSARKMEKVFYVDLEESGSEHPFTMVIFEKYFKHFPLKPDELIGRDVLVYGELRKDEYKEIRRAQIILKTIKLLEFISRKRPVVK